MFLILLLLSPIVAEYTLKSSVELGSADNSGCSIQTGTLEYWVNTASDAASCTTKIMTGSDFDVGTLKANTITATTKLLVKRIEVPGNNLLVIGSDISLDTGYTLKVTSDERLKRNIEPFLNGLQNVLDIPVHTYEYKRRRGIKHIGFLAQNVHKILPSAVEFKRDYIPELREHLKVHFEDNIMHTPLETEKGKFVMFKMDTIEKELESLGDGRFKCTACSAKNVDAQGEMVDDVHLLKQSHVFATHHGAIQELYGMIKMQEKRIQFLENKLKK